MSCRFDESQELCGHKVCEDDYEITEQELEEIELVKTKDEQGLDNVIFVDFVNKRRVA